ncbi:MAG: hypothetical protein ACKORF_07520 [Micrococcales bacterium]
MRIPLALRAALSLALGLVITFKQDHSAHLGLKVLAAYGLGIAAIAVVTAVLGRTSFAAIEAIPVAVVASVIGVLAILANDTNEAPIYDRFNNLVAAWGLISGVYELYLARRAGFRTISGKDSLLSSVLALALGVLFLLEPIRMDITTGVGFLGAYLVMSSVHLGIAAASQSKG